MKNVGNHFTSNRCFIPTYFVVHLLFFYVRFIGMSDANLELQHVPN